MRTTTHLVDKVKWLQDMWDLKKIIPEHFDLSFVYGFMFGLWPTYYGHNYFSAIRVCAQ